MVYQEGTWCGRHNDCERDKDGRFQCNHVHVEADGDAKYNSSPMITMITCYVYLGVEMT